MDGGVATSAQDHVDLASDQVDCQFVLNFQVLQHHLSFFDQEVRVVDRLPLQEHVAFVALHAQALHPDAMFALWFCLTLVNKFLERIVLLKSLS